MSKTNETPSALQRLVIWLKWVVAGKELEEAAKLKIRIRELEQWCGHEFPALDAGTKWLLDWDDYPGQFKGPKGDISDFREYLRKEFKPK